MYCWNKYLDQQQGDFNTAISHGERQVQWLHTYGKNKSTTYTIDFENMVQINPGSYNERKVRGYWSEDTSMEFSLASAWCDNQPAGPLLSISQPDSPSGSPPDLASSSQPDPPSGSQADVPNDDAGLSGLCTPLPGDDDDDDAEFQRLSFEESASQMMQKICDSTALPPAHETESAHWAPAAVPAHSQDGPSGADQDQKGWSAEQWWKVKDSAHSTESHDLAPETASAHSQDWADQENKGKSGDSWWQTGIERGQSKWQGRWHW